MYMNKYTYSHTYIYIYTYMQTYMHANTQIYFDHSIVLLYAHRILNIYACLNQTIALSFLSHPATTTHTCTTVLSTRINMNMSIQIHTLYTHTYPCYIHVYVNSLMEYYARRGRAGVKRYGQRGG